MKPALSISCWHPMGTDFLTLYRKKQKMLDILQILLNKACKLIAKSFVSSSIVNENI